MAKIPHLHTFSLLLLLLVLASRRCSAQQQLFYFKGMFVFGTSVVDNGNNNYLNGSLSKANYLPYGIDFIFGPTGRFTNGKNVADTIGDRLRLPLIPAFNDPRTRGPVILFGVNYGSGGSGILDDTGSIMGEVISLNQQIKNFVEVTLPELQTLKGDKSTKLLEDYLFLVATGNNDFLLNYFLQNSSSRPTLPVFVANLLSVFSAQLQRLYNVGARKFGLLTVYPIGCSPVVREVANSSQQCVKIVNQAAEYYNTQFIAMVDTFKQNMPGSQFVVVNTYNIVGDIIQNPIPKGFSNVTGPCCEVRESPLGGAFCKELGKVCIDRSKYAYFDGQHNTEAVNVVIAAKAFASNSTTEVYPFNLQRLAML